MGKLVLSMLAFAALAASYHEVQVAANENIPIFVRTKTGKTMLLEMPTGATVLMLKDQIEAREGYDQDQQLLVCEGTKLEDDDKLLEDYKIVGGSTINLVLPPPSGPIEQIFIEDLMTGRTMALNFATNITVEQIKIYFMSTIGYIFKQQRLIFQGKLLVGEDNLEYHNITAWSTITMALRFYKDEPVKTLFIRNPSGRYFIIDVRPEHTVADLKEMIANKEGIPQQQQELIFEDRLRRDDEDLADYDLDLYLIATLVLRPRDVPTQQVFIKTLYGGTVIVEADLQDSVANLKQKIESKTGDPSHLQKLIFDGQILEDSKQLSDYNVGAWSGLTLVVGPRDAPLQQIIVRTLSNEKIKIDISLNDTVATLKDKVRTQEGIHQHLQILVFDDKQLEDENQLFEYGIHDGSLVFMVLFSPDVKPWQ